MILNLTQHPASAEQVEAGVVDLQGADLMKLKKELNFDFLPTKRELSTSASEIVDLAIRNSEEDDTVMIGGAPFFMPYLVLELKMCDRNPVFAFSVRESVEKEIDGKVVKTSVFKHLGFVEV